MELAWASIATSGVRNWEIEFTTIMWFYSIDIVKEFTGGEENKEAHVSDAARALLTLFEAHAIHSTLRYILAYPQPKPE